METNNVKFCPNCNERFKNATVDKCSKCGGELKSEELKIEPVQSEENDAGVVQPKCPSYTGTVHI